MEDHRYFYASVSNADHGVNPTAPLCSLSCNGDGAKTSNGSILPGLRDALFLQSCFFLLSHVAELAPLTDLHLCILFSAGVFNRLATIGELALLISSQLSLLAKLSALASC
ncbi:hypothetical protein F383_10310 [Gossypium arboreum]|uniref:Uncharacterized protein n=1 Tax=Gossypium arboreum TaxID=29729 RepID=A0A0B0PJD4_GOSAR|nr:hypothetical protein F383_10310 [Gossypium arboreum]